MTTPTKPSATWKKNAEGRLAITRGRAASEDHLVGREKADARKSWIRCITGAHDQCFIANSVKTEVTVVQ